MAEKNSSVNPVRGDDSAARSTMIDMWRQSIERAAKKQTTAARIMQSESDTKADLEQKIRSGQAECPTCAARQYADESGDGGVSFQAARHINAASAGVVVMNHENEHVAAADRESNPEAGAVKDSTVTLQYGKCPECGKTYVKGAVTKTTTRPASYARSGGFSANA